MKEEEEDMIFLSSRAYSILNLTSMTWPSSLYLQSVKERKEMNETELEGKTKDSFLILIFSETLSEWKSQHSGRINDR